MSHDLQFQVDNGDGTAAYPTGGMTPMRGNEFDHLPDSASTHNQQPGAAASIQYIQQKLQQSSHPIVIIFHVLFKAAALVVYVFGGWFTGNDGASFITITVACVLLLAADFWTVKNVTGRLLVGLRWWNKVEDDTTTWIFESAHGRPVNPFDQTVFWTVLYLTPAVWLGLFVLGLIRFKFTWLMIVVMALALNGANVYGYYKCSGDQKARFEQMSQNYAQQGAYALVRAGVMGFVGGGGPGSGRNVV
jgi:Eukaryotic protein of unknown function (DUF846)